MKLKTLNEAKHSSQHGNIPLTIEAFNRVKKSIKPDLTQDEFAKFAAFLEYEMGLHGGRDDIQWILYNGISGTKDNPKQIEASLEFFVDEDFNEQERAAAWTDIMQYARKFFRGQQTRRSRQ